MNDGVRPIELPFEFVDTRRLADHHRACRGALIESRRHLFSAWSELGLVYIAPIGYVVSAVLEYCRQHAAMFGRAVDAERTLLHVGAARGHGVVVVKAVLPLCRLQKRLMCYWRTPADVADINRARLIRQFGRKTRHVNRERQVGAWPTGDARHVL